jgi:hypothetical protein
MAGLPEELRSDLARALEAHRTCHFDADARALFPLGPDDSGTWDLTAAIKCLGSLEVCEVGSSTSDLVEIQLASLQRSCDEYPERFIVIAKRSGANWRFSWPTRFGPGFQHFREPTDSSGGD